MTSALILVFHLIKLHNSGNLRSGAGYVWIKRELIYTLCLVLYSFLTFLQLLLIFLKAVNRRTEVI